MEKVRRGTDCGARRDRTGAAPNTREPDHNPGPAGRTKVSAMVLSASGRFVLRAGTGRMWLTANSPHSLPESSFASGIRRVRECGGE
jgi:hypothetical protein